ncbi:hypothetical protein [Paraburkholderia kururiensis]|nr:hypothetical protein [Paraburkholderia kururiensis]
MPEKIGPGATAAAATVEALRGSVVAFQTLFWLMYQWPLASAA